MDPLPATPGTAPRADDAPPLSIMEAPRFTKEQVVAASFLGTPLAGALLLSLNSAARGASLPLRVVPPALTLLSLLVALVLDAAVSTWALWVWIPLGASLLANLSDAPRDGDVPPDARRPATHWLILVVAVWCALLVSGALMGRAFGRDVPGLREVVWDVAVGDGEGQVRFDDGATRHDARRVRDVLQQSGHLQRGLRVHLTRTDGVLTLAVRVPPPVDEVLVQHAAALTQTVANDLVPPECVQGRVLDMGGRLLAGGQACPSPLPTGARQDTVAR